MTISKSSSSKLVVRGALLLLGLLLFLFFIYPPLLLFFKGRHVLLSRDFFNTDILEALGNSIRISSGVFILSTLIGGSLAWITVKTDFYLKKLIDNIVFIAFAIPPYILALSWMQLFGRNGYIERFIKVLNSSADCNMQPYSLTAVIIVMTLHLYPLMYMSIKNALEQVSPSMEKASIVSGASVLRMVSGVTLPAILPNILSTGLLVFSRTMANFAVPALLCLPVGIEVIPTGIYSALSSLYIDKAAALSLFLVLLSTALYIGQGVVLNRYMFAQAAGGAGDRMVVRLGKAQSACLLAIVLFFSLSLLLPLGSMMISSFLKRWGLPLETQYFTLKNYKQIFNIHGKALPAFRNSFFYGVTAAFLASAIGGAAAIVNFRRKSIAGKLIGAAASWPMAIPNTVLAVAAIFAWIKPPLKLYGSCWAIIITYAVLFTPIIMKQVSGLLNMQDKNLVNAARTAGAGSVVAFWTVSFPALVPGFKSGILLCMMIALREIPISLLLYSSGQETVGVLLFGMQSQSFGLEMTSALAIVVLAVIITGNNLVNRKGGKL